MVSRFVIAALMIATSAGTVVKAATLVNRQAKSVTITVIEGARKTDHTVAPAEKLTNVCQSGCLMRLNSNQEDEFEIDAGDALSIENGNIYFDTTPGDEAPPAGN